jgi:hypothetical protein
MRPFLIAVLLAGCPTEEAADPDPIARDAMVAAPHSLDANMRISSEAAVVGEEPRPSWHADIAPLLAAKCGGCHQQGGIAPFSVQSYALAKPFADMMAEAVEAGRMPPFFARGQGDCAPLPWAHDPRLKPEESALLRAWADHGAPEGSPRPPSAPPTPAKLAREDLTVKIPREVVVDGATDVHLCVALDPALDQDRWVLGAATTPGNRKVVHHVKTMTVLPGSTPGFFGIGATSRTKDELREAIEQHTGAKLGEYYECKAGDKLLDMQKEVLDVWAPGGGPRMAPPDSAMFVPRDALLLLNLHYHPSGTREVDATTQLSLQFADQKPARVAQNAEMGNFPADYLFFYPGRLVTQPGELSAKFMIPAGDSKHIEEMTWTWSDPSPVRIYSLFTHMHYVGKEMSVVLERGEQRQCLIDTPWDFNWQLVYDYDAAYDKLPELRSGDVLRMHCQYDNSPSNAALMRELELRGLSEPTDVQLGEDSTDEMCVAFVGITYPNPR